MGRKGIRPRTGDSPDCAHPEQAHALCPRQDDTASRALHQISEIVTCRTSTSASLSACTAYRDKTSYLSEPTTGSHHGAQRKSDDSSDLKGHRTAGPFESSQNG